jgi:HAD superfamily hydrolase (TIGR01484 family)
VGQPIPLPLVLQNGAALYASGEILQAKHSFPLDIQAALIERMLSHPQVTFWLYSLSEVHVLWPTPVMETMAQRFDLNTQPFTPASRDRQFTKVVCIAETIEPIQTFAAEMAELELEQSYSLPTVMEINRVGINKGTGLATLLDALKLTGAKIIAAGDGENDLPLFDVASLSFVPDSSPPAICARADQLINLRESGLLAPILQQIDLLQ